MNDATGTSAQVSQLRALLFTDLCDSTSLVERIGDSAAAALFQQHDRLVLALQQRWNGQQIDRSDGLFMLFERPVDALGFALDYQQGLTTLGREHDTALQARAGLHVGEVILWENSVEAIALGAKPVEVEGLAKPMAARLMQLALPGQILVSAIAESMARRASAELGDTGKGLRWKSFGRWRFKGVAQPMEVFAALGRNALSTGRPRQSAKAMRDVPLWRRPFALAAQVTLVMAVLVGGWFLTKPQPAIAFGERDWVVVGQLKNFTSDALLNDSLEQALRVSLEQSRYLNVLTDDQVSRTMSMMRASDTAPLDRTQASAVAIRSGARLVLMPMVATIGGRARFSVEVVDPQSQRTLASASADAGQGQSAILHAVDEVSQQLRQQLGEARTSIGNRSQPLPEVTTTSLDALRAYALGQKRYSRGDIPGALAFYRQATQIDPEFALAWLAQSRALFVVMDYAGAAQILQEASQRAQHLTPREQMYVQNWTLQIVDPDRATDGWARMAELYPDYMPASYNAGLNLFHENRMTEALALARKVVQSKVELPEVAQDQFGRTLLATEQYAAAEQAFARAASNGWTGALLRQATSFAAQRDHARAKELMDRIDPANFHAANYVVTMALDQGDTARAIQVAELGRMRAQDKRGMDRYNFDLPLAVAYMVAGRTADALQVARAAAVDPFVGIPGQPAVEVVDRLVAAHAAAILALRLGDATPAMQVRSRMAALGARPDSLVLQQFETLLEARLLHSQGRSAQAMELLQPLLQRQPRVQLRVAAYEFAEASGNHGLASEQAAWLRKSPGFAYSEAQCSFCLLALNVVDIRRVPGAAAGNPRVAAMADQRSVRGVP